MLIRGREAREGVAPCHRCGRCGGRCVGGYRGKKPHPIPVGE